MNQSVFLTDVFCDRIYRENKQTLNEKQTTELTISEIPDPTHRGKMNNLHSEQTHMQGRNKKNYIPLIIVNKNQDQVRN